jgi:hypothetical protein
LLTVFIGLIGARQQFLTVLAINNAGDVSAMSGIAILIKVFFKSKRCVGRTYGIGDRTIDQRKRGGVNLFYKSRYKLGDHTELTHLIILMLSIYK